MPGVLERSRQLYRKGGIRVLLSRASDFLYFRSLEGSLAILEQLPSRHQRQVIERYYGFRRRVRPAAYSTAVITTPRWIDPSEIQWISPLDGVPQRHTIKAGTWDRQKTALLEHPVRRAIEARITDQVPWEETLLYEYFQNKIDRLHGAWGYKAPDSFADRGAELDQLIEQIQTEGYVPAWERDGARPNDPTLSIFDEPSVDIGRDGTLFWRSFGLHRLSIAQVLGVEEIPIYVITRHKEWERKRRERTPSFASHPDIRASAQ